MTPHGEHIVVLPFLLYKALLATVGMGSALPFRIVSVGLFLLSAVLLFTLLRRRVVTRTALLATAIVLFLGAAWEDLLWPFQMGYFGAVACGLGAILALEREHRGTDFLAAALLILAVGFSSLGLSFAIGAAVVILFGADRWGRIYVFLAPAALYLAWYLGWGQEADSAISVHNAVRTPLYVLESVGAAIASLLGLGNPAIAKRLPGPWLALLGMTGVALTAWQLRRGQRSRWTWALLAAALSFWVLAGLNQTPGREPDSSRYQYVNVVFLLLVAVELLRGTRLTVLTRNPSLPVLAVATFSLVCNLHSLVNAYSDIYHPISELEKAGLGAVEVTRDTVEPSFVLSEDLVGTGLVNIEAAPYLAARDRWGSPAYDTTELAASSAAARFAADKVLAAALGLSLEPVSGPAAANRCEALRGTGATPPVLRVPPGGAVIEAGAASITAIAVRRYSDEFPVQFPGLAAGETARLRIPADRSSKPWEIELRTAGTAELCGLSRRGSG